MTNGSVFDRDEACDWLVVTDWAQRLAFYQLSGKQVNHEHRLQLFAFVACYCMWENK